MLLYFLCNHKLPTAHNFLQTLLRNILIIIQDLYIIHSLHGDLENGEKQCSCNNRQYTRYQRSLLIRAYNLKGRIK